MVHIRTLMLRDVDDVDSMKHEVASATYRTSSNRFEPSPSSNAISDEFSEHGS
jgi:hypothetical protein